MPLLADASPTLHPTPLPVQGPGGAALLPQRHGGGDAQGGGGAARRAARTRGGGAARRTDRPDVSVRRAGAATLPWCTVAWRGHGLLGCGAPCDVEQACLHALPVGCKAAQAVPLPSGDGDVRALQAAAGERARTAGMRGAHACKQHCRVAQNKTTALTGCPIEPRRASLFRPQVQPAWRGPAPGVAGHHAPHRRKPAAAGAARATQQGPGASAGLLDTRGWRALRTVAAVPCKASCGAGMLAAYCGLLFTKHSGATAIRRM